MAIRDLIRQTEPAVKKFGQVGILTSEYTGTVYGGIRACTMLFVILIAMLCGTSCGRKDLSEPGHHHGEKIKVKISLNLHENVDASLLPATFNLVAVPRDGAGYPVNQHVRGTDGEVYIIPGRYDILVYTSDFYELDANYYRGMDNIWTSEAYTRQALKSKVGTKSEYVMEEPDPTFALLLEDYEIQEGTDNNMTMTLEPLSYKYWFNVDVEGLDKITSVTFEISGMCTSVYLADGHHREEEFALQSVEAKILKDENKIYGEFWSFGPHQGMDVTNKMTLTFVNGRVIRYELDDISSYIKQLTKGGEIPIKDKIIINVDDSGAGFHPSVGEWDDVVVDVPI